MSASEGSREGSWRYGLLVVTTLLVGVAGYLGYALYPRFDLPAAEGAALLALAAAAGIASFFSPCAFPLLVSLLAREGGAAYRRDGTLDGASRSEGRPVVFASALAGGAAVFLLLCGGAIALGGGALIETVTFTTTTSRLIRGVLAVVLAVLAAIQLGWLPDWLRPMDRTVRPLLRARAEERRRRPALGFFLFGFGYLLAGFG